MKGQKSLGLLYRRVIIDHCSIGKPMKEGIQIDATYECSVVSQLTQIKSFNYELEDDNAHRESSTNSHQNNKQNSDIYSSEER